MVLTMPVPIPNKYQLVTAPFLHHLETLNHFEETLKQLSQSMAKFNAIIDHITPN